MQIPIQRHHYHVVLKSFASLFDFLPLEVVCRIAVSQTLPVEILQKTENENCIIFRCLEKANHYMIQGWKTYIYSLIGFYIFAL